MELNLKGLMSLNVYHAENINLSEILHNLHRKNVITAEQYCALQQKYSSSSFEDPWQGLFLLLIDICDIAGFEVSFRACHASNNFQWYQASQIQQVTLTNEPAKKILPCDQMLLSFITDVRKAVDDDVFSLGNKVSLGKLISIITDKIDSCQDQPERFQYQIDKRNVLYTVLAQQYLNIKDRNKVMRKMHDAMPNGVDRTVFNVLYHSLMSINCAIQRNTPSSEKHEQIVMQNNSNYSSRFLAIIAYTGSLYRTAVACQQEHSSDDFMITKLAFYQSMASTVGMDPDEGMIHRGIIMLEHARDLLGIDLDCSMCDIQDIETKCIIRARDIMRILEDEDLPRRRKMKFLLNKGRLHELCNTTMAVEYVIQALELVNDETEKYNMEKYLEKLLRQHRPQI